MSFEMGFWEHSLPLGYLLGVGHGAVNMDVLLSLALTDHSCPHLLVHAGVIPVRLRTPKVKNQHLA